MGFTAFSVASGLVWFHIAILLVSALRAKSAFLTRHSELVLFTLFLLGLARMVLPLDFPFTYVVQSWMVLPALQQFLRLEPVPRLTVGVVILLVWLVGGVATAWRIVARLLREKRTRAGFRPVESPQVDRVLRKIGARRVSVTVVVEVDVPIVTGIFHAHIYLPRITLTDAELDLILRHELRHVQSHDTLLKLCYLVLRVFFWWNPLVASFQSELDRLLELRCDAGVIKTFDESKKQAYLASILAVVRQVPASGGGTMSFADSASLCDRTATPFLFQRFRSVLAEQAEARVHHIAALSVLVAAFMLSYMIVVQPAGKPLEADGGFLVNNHNAYVLVEDDIWKLYVDGKYAWDVPPEEQSVEPFSGLSRFGEER